MCPKCVTECGKRFWPSIFPRGPIQVTAPFSCASWGSHEALTQLWVVRYVPCSHSLGRKDTYLSSCHVPSPLFIFLLLIPHKFVFWIRETEAELPLNPTGQTQHCSFIAVFWNYLRSSTHNPSPRNLLWAMFSLSWLEARSQVQGSMLELQDEHRTTTSVSKNTLHPPVIIFQTCCFIGRCEDFSGALLCKGQCCSSVCWWVGKPCT